MSLEKVKIDGVVKDGEALYNAVDKDGKYVQLNNLPEGARNIIFNKDDLINAQKEANEKGEEVNIKNIESKNVMVEIPEEIKDPADRKEIAISALTKKMEELDRIEEIRGDLGATESNKEETENLARKKAEIQETLTGMRQQTTEIVNPQKDLEKNTLVSQELPKGWEGFKKEWYGNRVEDNFGYLETSQQIMHFSENLASTDSEYAKRLSHEVFLHERNGDMLRGYKGLDEKGRVIKKNGETGNYAYTQVGASMSRYEYESKLLEAYAKEKGII